MKSFRLKQHPIKAGFEDGKRFVNIFITES